MMRSATVPNRHEDLIFMENFFEQVFDCEIFQVTTEAVRTVRRIVMQAPHEVELILSRADQDALNRFSLIMVETVVKRLEYQINQNQIMHCKAWLHTFCVFAKHSKRFRDTIRRSHTIHLWLGLLRNSLQWETHILADAIQAMYSVIVEINAAFNTEYVYWKKLIPDLIELICNCRRRMPYQPLSYSIESPLHEIFALLLKEDFSFLGHAHTQMESKRFTNLLQITDAITHDVEIDYSNSYFCAQLAEKLEHQEWPEGIGEAHPERRKVYQLVQLLKKIWGQRVHRAADQRQELLTSSSSEAESVAGDEEEDMVVAQIDSNGEEEENQHRVVVQQQQPERPRAPIRHRYQQQRNNNRNAQMGEDEDELEELDDGDGAIVLMVRGQEEEQRKRAAAAQFNQQQNVPVQAFSFQTKTKTQHQSSPRQHPHFQFRQNPPPPPSNAPPPPPLPFLQSSPPFPPPLDQQQKNFHQQIVINNGQQQKQRSPVRMEEEAQEEEEEFVVEQKKKRQIVEL